MSPLSTRKALIGARALIADPSAWGQGVRYMRPGTRCASEALEAVTVGDRRAFNEAWDALSEAAPSQYVSDFNDTHTHAEVLAAFDRAIGRTGWRRVVAALTYPARMVAHYSQRPEGTRGCSLRLPHIDGLDMRGRRR